MTCFHSDLKRIGECVNECCDAYQCTRCGWIVYAEVPQ